MASGLVGSMRAGLIEYSLLINWRRSCAEVAKERTNYRLGKVPVQFQLVLVPILVPPCHLRPVNPQLYSTLLVIAVFVA
jgi:hypothetical protein